MPTFKPKNTKRIKVNKKSTVTLDGKHTELINKFNQEQEELLPSLRELKKTLENCLNNKNILLEEKLDIQDKIQETNNQIKEIKKKKKGYLLDNSKYIFNYFENKKSIAEGNNKTKVLNNFFNINKQTDESREKDCRSDVQKYLTNIDDSFLDLNAYITPTDICRHCNKGELIPVDHEGILVCNQCSKSVKFLVENEKPSYKEPPKEVCFYAYKRINHFREILAQFQAKETTQIPDDVLENIRNQIKKREN